MTTRSHGPKIDVYDMLSLYVSREHKKGSVTPITIKQRVSTIRTFLEYNDVEISDRKFKLKVKIPKVVRQNKEALSKEEIVNIINGCSNIKLKTYVMFLAATGCRASEALSTRLTDLDFEKNRVFIRGEYSKTKTDRHVFLTTELLQQIKSWLNFKYRTRRISHHNPKSIELKTPMREENDLVFSAAFGENNPSVKGLYITLVGEFEKTLDRLGGKYAQYENSKKRRRKFTLHSFRRHVKSTISDLGYGDFSEYMIGHSFSTYYRRPDKDKYELFQKIEPYLTYLDFASLERKGADISTRIEQVEQDNQKLRSYLEKMEHAFSNLDTNRTDIEMVLRALAEKEFKVEGGSFETEMKKFYETPKGRQITKEIEAEKQKRIENYKKAAEEALR